MRHKLYIPTGNSFAKFSAGNTYFALLKILVKHFKIVVRLRIPENSTYFFNRLHFRAPGEYLSFERMNIQSKFAQMSNFLQFLVLVKLNVYKLKSTKKHRQVSYFI